jgi:hypothetical protein
MVIAPVSTKEIPIKIVSPFFGIVESLKNVDGN